MYYSMQVSKIKILYVNTQLIVSQTCMFIMMGKKIVWEWPIWIHALVKSAYTFFHLIKFLTKYAEMATTSLKKEINYDLY